MKIRTGFLTVVTAGLALASMALAADVKVVANANFALFTAAVMLCGTSLAMAASEFQVICNLDIKATSIFVDDL